MLFVFISFSRNVTILHAQACVHRNQTNIQVPKKPLKQADIIEDLYVEFFSFSNEVKNNNAAPYKSLF